MDLTGKTVIVTGASSGIGAGTARLLHAVGARPVLAARRADRLAVLSAELGGALAVPTDVTDPAQVRGLVAASLDQHQRVDGLVNNVGASLRGPLAEVDPAEYRVAWDRTTRAKTRDFSPRTPGQGSSWGIPGLWGCDPCWACAD